MKVLAIRTQNGNFLANHGGYYFYVSADRKKLLRMSNESEWNHANDAWGQTLETRHIKEIKDIITLSSISEKVGFRIDSFSNDELEKLDIENFEERFSYENNDFNRVVGFYANSVFQWFSPECAGRGMSEYGNHGVEIEWEGETYLNTLKRFILETSEYPTIMVVENSDHHSRSEGWRSEFHAFVLPAQEQIDDFFNKKYNESKILRELPIGEACGEVCDIRHTD